MTAIYHITHVENLPTIIQRGRLLCPVFLVEQNLSHLNIAHQNIQSRRVQKKVPLAPFGVLHDYVPFYFAPRSPMLYTINRGNVEGYSDGQTPIIHLVTSAEVVADEKRPFVFTDGHAIIAISKFYNDLGNLDQIDWKLMKAKYWRDTDEDGDRLRRRNAEFLIYHFLPWTLIHEIGVINKTIGEKVEDMLSEQPHRPLVKIRGEWYYEN